jgi:xanthine dehydrogenase/oxidase
MEPVGQSVIHASARLQVTGEAKYLDDMPEPPGMLYASVVLSSKPHARIVKIDTSAALAVPGAVKFIGAADVSGSNVSGEVIPDEEVFASKEVHTVGQLVGLLVATTPQAANAAARLVKIDYEDLPAVLSIRDAIACGSFFPFAHEIGSGDGAIGNGAGIEAALQASSHIVTGECAIGGQEHFYFETNACLCVPGEMGEMTVHASTQVLFQSIRFVLLSKCF